MQAKNSKKVEYLIIFCCFAVFIFFNINFALAYTNPGGFAAPNAITTNDPGTQAQVQTGNAITKEGFLEQILSWFKQWSWEKAGAVAYWSALKTALNTIAYDTATWIGSGDKGQKPMFITEGWGEYLINVADNAAGTFIEKVGANNNWGDFNLCNPDFKVKISIGLGLIEQSRPQKPECTFSKMIKNWEEELENPNFLNNFQDMFNPTSSDLGIALTMQTNLAAKIDEEAKYKELERLQNKGWLDVRRLSGESQSPPGHAESRLEEEKRIREAGFMQVTKDAFTDAANVFINQLAVTLFNNLLESIGKEGSNYTNPYDWSKLNFEGSGGGGLTTKGAREKFKKIIQPDFSVRGDYNILAELTQCPNPSKAGPTNCVITENFRQAVINKMTVGEAMKQGFLNQSGTFAFTADGLEPSYNEGFPYRSMIILRKFRILPVGWEVAGQYIKTNSSSIDGTKNLKDMVDCFDADDDYAGYQASWCRGLVDPNWVLKAPLNYCKREGPGPEIVSEQVIIGLENKSELNILRGGNYCADEQSCIKEYDDGSCELYGYCTEEKRKWEFSGKTCEPKYNTCQTFRNRAGRTISYLENTIDYSDCSQDNVGCRSFCTDYDFASQAWNCTLAAANNRVYLDQDAEQCSSENEGCHEFIRTQLTGANLLTNSGFEEIIQPGDMWDGDGTQITPVSPDTAFAGSYVLQLTGNLYKNIAVGPSDYSVGGEAYTLSFYAKDCGDTGSFGLASTTAQLSTTNEWKYFTITHFYDDFSYIDNDIELVIVGFTPSPACIIDNIKLERGYGTTYSDYRGSGLIYEKLAPDYLNCDGVDDPAECSNFVRKCQASEVGCELYTSAADGVSVPARVTAHDYCPAECLGYDTYIQKESVFDSMRDAYFIPKTAKTCDSSVVGCDEFTNLDEVNKGGEGIEYYKYLRQCIKPGDSAANCSGFYTWEGSNEAGYQLRVFEYQRLTAVDEPLTIADDSALCNATIYSLSPSDPSYNPDCREYYNRSGEKSYHLFNYTITCSDNCYPFRRTWNNIDPTITAQGNCNNGLQPTKDCNNSTSDGLQYCWDTTRNVCYNCKNGGYWDSQHGACLYNAIPKEGERCAKAQAGCREYAGNSGNNMRVILNNNFEGGTDGWVGINGAAATNDSTALLVGGESLKITKAAGAPPFMASTTIGDLVSEGNAYVLNFLAKAETGATILTAWFSNGTATTSFAGQVDLTASDWGIYQMSMINLNYAPTDGESLVISADGPFYIDDVKITEIADKYYLIKDSWKTPNSCDQDIFGNPYALYMLGCDQYSDRDNNTHYLHSFSRLCQESAIGCELMIDTHNSTAIGGGIWNDADSDGICFNEAGCVSVSGDNYDYIVYDHKKQCSQQDKGCQLLGDSYRYFDDVIWTDTHLKNDPDKYDLIVCDDLSDGCEEWKTDDGVDYFKDPGDQVCEWRQAAAVVAGSWGWYKKKINRCDTNSDGAGDGNICLKDSDCTTSQLCKLESTDLPCPVYSLKTFGYGGIGNAVSQPIGDANGNWTGTCPASASGCGEYIDPISRFSENLIFNSDFSQDVDSNSIADGWSSGVDGEQDIALEENSLYILSVTNNNTATLFKPDIDGNAANDIIFSRLNETNNLLTFDDNISVSAGAGSRASAVFYVSAPDPNEKKIILTMLNSAVNNGSKVELKKAMVSYQLKQDIDKDSCNGIVDFENGCVLFNKRAQDGLQKAGLSFDADLTFIDGMGASPISGAVAADNDSNLLLKVNPDRVCGKWLACRSIAAIKDEKGREKNTCYDIGLCDSTDENGNCDNFVLENKKEQSVAMPGDFSQYANSSGYAKVGYSGVSDYSMKGAYQLGTMDQKGELVNIPNGDFEFVDESGHPIGWTGGGSYWNENMFSVIDNPVEAQEESVDYPASGNNFLKLGVAASSSSELISVLNDTDYILTASVNTVNLSNGQAKIKVEEYSLGGLKTGENDIIVYNSGRSWSPQLGKFTTNGNTSTIRLVLYTNGGVGNYYFDDIKIRPSLESRNNWYTPQTCRLYPEEDSLSCDYYAKSGLRMRGWWGNCLEYDRYPGSPDACLLWWPVDKVKSDGIEEGIGYSDKLPLYYCYEAKGQCIGNGEQIRWYCDKLAQVVTFTGQNKFWSGRVYEGSNFVNVFNFPTSIYSIDWGPVQGGLENNINMDYSRNSLPFGSILSPGSIDPSEWDADDSTPTVKEPLLVLEPTQPKDVPNAGTPYYGEDKTCSLGGTVNSGCNHYSGSAAISCTDLNSDSSALLCPQGYTRVACSGGDPGGNNNWYNCNYSSGGRDGCSAGEGHNNQGGFACSITCEYTFNYNIAPNLAESLDGLKRIFAQSYGSWAWDGSKYAPTYSTWDPPSALCNGTGSAPRPAYPNDLCSVLPLIQNIKINDLTSGIKFTKNGFARLTFNTDIDDQQMPLVMYAVDWGDNEKTFVTGVEMRDKPNLDDPHILYHLYNYWDLRAKQSIDQGSGQNMIYCGDAGKNAVDYTGTDSGYTCGSGSACCVIKPKVQIKDNWGWCNHGAVINVCGNGQWDGLVGWVAVEEK